MLIYLLPEEQDRAISLFHYGLKVDGILFLGSSEGLGMYSAEFETINSHAKLFKNSARCAYPWISAPPAT